jgi:hypothetical protein
LILGFESDILHYLSSEHDTSAVWSVMQALWNWLRRNAARNTPSERFERWLADSLQAAVKDAKGPGNASEASFDWAPEATKSTHEIAHAAGIGSQTHALNGLP